MSHVSRLKLFVKDLDALGNAARSLQTQLNRGQTTYRTYAGTKNPCLHAIVDPNNFSAYEVGVVKNPDGEGFELMWDPYADGGGIVTKLGPNASFLRQQYAKEVALKDMYQQGWMVQQQELPNGDILVTGNIM